MKTSRAVWTIHRYHKFWLCHEVASIHMAPNRHISRCSSSSCQGLPVWALWWCKARTDVIKFTLYSAPPMVIVITIVNMLMLRVAAKNYSYLLPSRNETEVYQTLSAQSRKQITILVRKKFQQELNLCSAPNDINGDRHEYTRQRRQRLYQQWKSTKPMTTSYKL